MTRRPERSIVLLAVACAASGVLAAAGWLDSMMAFPFVFAAICLLFGGSSIWRRRRERGVAVPIALLLLGTALAVGGGLYRGSTIRDAQAREQREVSAELRGKPAPPLTGLEPLETDPFALQAAASFEHRATVVTFWATWCSPCWREMEELQNLWEQHRSRGLTVLAVTSYDTPEDPVARAEERTKAAEFLRRRGLRYPAAITAEHGNHEAYRVRSIPRTVLVDGQGTLVGYAVGLPAARELMARAAAMVEDRLPGAGAGGDGEPLR